MPDEPADVCADLLGVVPTIVPKGAFIGEGAEPAFADHVLVATPLPNRREPAPVLVGVHD
jgi:hypothetical protein